MAGIKKLDAGQVDRVLSTHLPNDFWRIEKPVTVVLPIVDVIGQVIRYATAKCSVFCL